MCRCVLLLVRACAQQGKGFNGFLRGFNDFCNGFDRIQWLSRRRQMEGAPLGECWGIAGAGWGVYLTENGARSPCYPQELCTLLLSQPSHDLSGACSAEQVRYYMGQSETAARCTVMQPQSQKNGLVLHHRRAERAIKCKRVLDDSREKCQTLGAETSHTKAT